MRANRGVTRAEEIGIPSIKTQKPMSGYRCQFCGTTSPVKKWKQKGAECPECGRVYDAMIAQEEETE